MISQTAEYALQIVTHLARQATSEPPTTVQISKATGVPSNYLAKVLHGLSRAASVHSQRGRGGGHELVREPADLTLLQVINAVDPLTRIQACSLGLKDHRDLEPFAAGWMALCPRARRPLP